MVVTKSPFIKRLSLALCSSILLLFTTCGQDTEEPSELTLYKTNTGSYSCKLIFPDDITKNKPVNKSVLSPDGSDIDCQAAGIVFIKFSFFTAVNTPLKTGKFPCSEGKGSVTDIPAQSGIRVLVTAENDDGEILFYGEELNVTIYSNKETKSGEIVMRYSSLTMDLDHDGFTLQEDCNDADPHVYPGAKEVCNSKDDDCNGLVDDDCRSPVSADTYANHLAMTFNLIPAGTFWMGSPLTDFARDADNEEQHEVTLTQSFYMQSTEVTQEQWVEVMGSNPSYFRECGDCPVEQVSWDDAQEFIARLNSVEDNGEYRLPTEAEWEYAARGDRPTAFSNGEITGYDPNNEFACIVDPNLEKVGWYCYNSADTTHPVAGKEPNDYGLFDMHGNVWEWCEDWYGSDYYSLSSRDDPEGPSTGSHRVIRGGSWLHFARLSRSATRGNRSPVDRSYVQGVRLVFLRGQ